MPRRSILPLFPLLSVGLVIAGAGTPVVADIPPYDHIVVVIEENKAYSQILLNSAAPYINQLAGEGMLFTNFHGMTHPSQPNYLEFFSGSNQGVTSNSVPVGLPFTTPNLGAELIAAGKTFGGYSQTLPSVGFTGATSGQYMRKHNPWVNWQDTSVTPAANTLPAAVNMPFTSFPSNFALLPTVSIVVPDQDNDMHDGTVATADTWLNTNLDAYYQYAKNPANKSLFIVTWDEDDSSSGNNNRIATIVAGAGVIQGQNNKNWNLHNLLRTIEDASGLSTHAGNAANVASITGLFSYGANYATKEFRQGDANGYSGQHDTQVRQANPTTAFGSNTTPLVVDLDDPSTTNNQSQALLRFDDIIGPGANQIPLNATVTSATLTLVTTDGTAGTLSLHRLLTSFNDNDASPGATTWNNAGNVANNGFSLNGAGTADDDYLATAESTFATPGTGVLTSYDVTASLQSWANGGTNNGWLVISNSTDGWRFNSAEYTTDPTRRPFLSVTYLVPEPASAALLFVGGAAVSARRRTRV